MIRKFGKIGTDRRMVLNILQDTDNWTQWMPALESMETLQRSEGFARLILNQRMRGRRLKQVIDCRFVDNGILLTQHRGEFKKWALNWLCMAPPDGRGTTLKCEVEIEMRGVMGLLASDRVVDMFLDDLFRESLTHIEARARELEAQAVEGEVAPGEEILLSVYQTPQGLEIRMGENTFFVSSRTGAP